MAEIDFANIGAIGIVKDRSFDQLPPEAWTDGEGIRFQNNAAKRTKGEEVVFDPPSVAPYWTHFIDTPSDFYWIYAGLNALYAYDMVAGTHTDITRAVGGPYAGVAEGPHTGGIFGGMMLYNNGVDVPQVFQDPTLLNDFEDLPNWPAGHVAKIIRPWGEVIVAMDIIKSGARSPHMIRISHPADPGSVPSSWDETDATKDVIERELSDTTFGFIVDGAPLRDQFIIYKENSTWFAQFIGGQFVYRTKPIFENSGCLAANCIGIVGTGNQHFVAVRNDLHVHDGQTIRSVLSEKQREFLRQDIDSVNFKRSFVVTHQEAHEMWFCYPSAGNTIPNKAITWNWEDNTVGARSLSDAAYIGVGPVEKAVVGETWDGDTDSWNSDSTLWSKDAFGLEVKGLLQCDPTATKLVELDTLGTVRGSNPSVFVERQGLAIVGRDRQGNWIVDPSTVKQVKSIWPRVTGGAVNIRIGSQQTLDGPITYSAAQTFDPDTDQRLDFLDTFPPGPYIAVRFESASFELWELNGYRLDLDLLGSL